MKVYWYPADYNVGDTLTPFILNHFRKDILIERASPRDSKKLLMVGSIMKHVKPFDTVLGTGIMRKTDRFLFADSIRFLAVRGKLTRDILINDGGKVPEVYGDPALLLPLMYKPDVEKEFDVGLIPHYVDKKFVKETVLPSLQLVYNCHFIDVALNWKPFVNQVLRCKQIISSSLHGIIIAEAYGIKATWVRYSDKVIGDGFKFRDYLTGTQREIQDCGTFPRITNLEVIQNGLLSAIQKI